MDKVFQGDCLDILKSLDADSVNCCVTSPPYWGLRNYGHDKQLGSEDTPEEYVENMVSVFRKVWRVLKKDGTLWLNLGDSYAGSNKGMGKDGLSYAGKKQATNKGSVGIGDPIKAKDIGLKPKDLVGIPWRVAFALQADGWYLRQDIIWHKPNVMPESVHDRCTKSHEYIFLFSKSPKYYFDQKAIQESCLTEQRNRESATDTGEFRNRRSVWSITMKSFKGDHFAVFPADLAELCILAGCPRKGIVLDPFLGSGTTALMALRNERRYIGIELNPVYARLAKKRIEMRDVSYSNANEAIKAAAMKMKPLFARLK